MQLQARKRADPTVAHEPAAPAAGASAAPVAAAKTIQQEPEAAGWLQILVTPKLTFNVTKQPGWSTAEDIPQDELREAFLSRFPVRFDAAKLTFQCATPSLKLGGLHRLVMRM